MSKTIHISGSACNMIGGLIGVLGWLLRFTRLMLVSKAVLAAKLLAAESVIQSSRNESLNLGFGAFLRSMASTQAASWLSEWRKLAHVTRPDTVIAWRRGIAKLLWRWKSRPGRPRTAASRAAPCASADSRPAHLYRFTIHLRPPVFPLS